MGVPYFIKEHLQMSAFDEALKNTFGRSKASSKLTLKTKWYHSCGCCDSSLICEQLKNWYLHDIICLTGISEEKHLKLRLFESNLRSCSYLKCSAALWLLLDPSCKGNFWLGASGQDCHQMPKIRHLQKMEVVFKSQT